MSWQNNIDPALPYWADYLPFLRKLDGPGFPVCDQLNAILPAGLKSHGGQTVRFVPSTELTDAAYEQRIFSSGQISTRPEDWHDLFNALVWVRFPAIKTAMNALHYREFSGRSAATRGKLRDALTLFDECGVIVFAPDPETLRLLSERRWSDLFESQDIRWGKDIHLVIAGHALLEKYLSPYKSMTAKALLVQVDTDCMDLPRNRLLERLDVTLAEGMLKGDILTQPTSLTPLPLAGIPGWWFEGGQDQRFYDDPQVFRQPPANLLPAPVVNLYLL